MTSAGELGYRSVSEEAQRCSPLRKSLAVGRPNLAIPRRRGTGSGNNQRGKNLIGSIPGATRHTFDHLPAVLAGGNKRYKFTGRGLELSMNEISIVDEASETQPRSQSRGPANAPAPSLIAAAPRLDILNLNNIFMNEWTRHKSPREYCGTGIRLPVHAATQRIHAHADQVEREGKRSRGEGERRRTDTVY